MMIETYRRLPHWVPDDVPVFVTFRLAGTLPVEPNPSAAVQPPGGAGFVKMDLQLDRVSGDARWLADPRIARMLVDALHYGQQEKHWYVLHAYVVMPNHVHIVWTPRVSMPRILQW